MVPVLGVSVKYVAKAELLVVQIELVVKVAILPLATAPELAWPSKPPSIGEYCPITCWLQVAWVLNNNIKNKLKKANLVLPCKNLNVKFFIKIIFKNKNWRNKLVVHKTIRIFVCEHNLLIKTN